MNKKSTSKSGFFRPRIFLCFVLCSMGASLGLVAFGGGSKLTFANSRNLSLKQNAVVPTLSPALRDLPTVAQLLTKQAEIGDTERRLTGRQVQDLTRQDPIVKNAPAAANMPAVLASFEGMNIDQACGSCLPPDTDGAVGPNHYVQMVNSDLAVFNKTTGAMISGPTPINHLWSSGECAVNNDGDPIVIYDQLADRWLISQFIASAAPSYAQCIAISTSPDPTGTYYAYEFDQSTTVFHDYPKMAVWPDAYYMTSNEFPSSQETNSGAGEFAFERPKMLLGQPARFIWFDSSNLAIGAAYVPGGQNPTNLDGKTPPPVGAPNYIVEVDALPSTPDPTNTSAVLVMWKFHVDWNNPANSTLGTGSGVPSPAGGGLYTAAAGHPDFQVPIANFIAAQCVYGQGPNCVPEKIVAGLNAATLDTLGDRTMFRVTYRNFGDHESMVVHHTVVTAADAPNGATRTGLRWYEVRNLSTTPTIYQQSTFAPLDPANPLWRWMGSAAMDHMGDIAIGYSASGPSYYPSIHYAGRLATDPLNDLTQGENVMFAGLGIQGFPLNRWGDYSDLTVDPNDDCTFWYTQEYAPTNPTPSLIDVNWHTRIGSFRFAQCVTANSVAITSVVSRKTHSFAGPFDVPLPLTGGGIEDRSGGPNGNHQIVATFAVPVTFTGATTSCGSVAGTSTSGNAVTINLTGVPNASVCSVTLNGVTDGTSIPGDATFPMNFLLGDTNADRFCDAIDVAQTKSQSGNPVTNANFREDVNVDGFIDAVDTSLVKSKSGTALP